MNRWLTLLKTIGAALAPRLLGLGMMGPWLHYFFFAEIGISAMVINRELGTSAVVIIRSDSLG